MLCWAVVQVDTDIMEPDTAGRLSMFSAFFPGPGFSGALALTLLVTSIL
jgi:hypothetical protein